MKTLTIFLMAVLVAITAVPAQPVAGQGNGTSVTAAGAGAFAVPPLFNGIRLSSVEFGQGVLISEDGTATGGFGFTLRGQGQTISLEGNASRGSVDSNGSASFSGYCTMDLGNGLPLQGVELIVTVTRGSLALKIGTTSLPAVSVNAGSMTIK